jgi:hypothetical protein
VIDRGSRGLQKDDGERDVGCCGVVS